MISNAELEARVQEVRKWSNGFNLALIAIESQSPTNAAKRAQNEGLTLPEIKRVRDIRLYLDRKLGTSHDLLQGFFKNNRDNQGGQEMAKKMTKKETLRALAEIWKERGNHPEMQLAAEGFLEKDLFDPEQIEKHLGVQLKWDYDSPPLDKNISWTDMHRQHGSLYLKFSESGKQENGKSTRVLFTFSPFASRMGLTLSISTYPGKDERQSFSLERLTVNSIVLNSSRYSGKSAVFDVGSVAPNEPNLRIKMIGRNQLDFIVEIKIPNGRSNSYMTYRYVDLKPIA